MRRIAKNFKGHYKEIILGPLFKLFEAILELFVPLVMANIIDIGVKNRDTAYIIRHGLILVVLAVLGIITAMICQYYAAVAAGHFGRSLRSQLYKHILTLSPKDIAPYGASGLITRLTNDTNQMQTGVNMSIRLASRAPFLAIGSIIMAMVVNFKIGLIFFISTPLVILVLYFIMKRTLPRYVDIQEQQDTLSRLAGENMEGVRVIRAFSRQKQEAKQFDHSADKLTELTVRVGKISAALNPLTSVIINLAIVVIVWLGSEFAFSGTTAPGEIIALVNYMNQTLLALIVAANLIVLFTRAIASSKRVAQVLNTEPSIKDGAGATEDSDAPSIEFQKVSFSYHAQAENALNDISFAAPRGSTVGIIGGTGSGKSTLANLLMRYYDTTGGTIRINGADIKDYPLHILRGKLGLVPQTAALFSGTIRYNLAVGNQQATESQMWEALKVAQGADFVEKSPQRLDTAIEEGGKNLSGGQRQRLTIARALVKNPEILILDDSASALDYATDAALRNSLHDSRQNLTTLIISQRAAAVKNANLILVLHDGELVAAGEHSDLLQSSPIYHEICVSQGLVTDSEVMA